MPGRPPCQNATTLLAALKEHMAAQLLSQSAAAEALGISVSTLSRALKTDCISNDVRARVQYWLARLGAGPAGDGEAATANNQQQNVGQILHLLQQADSLLADIRKRVSGLANAPQAES
jgi:DNA-binding LacI/PurR family transcriptional regulator